MMDADMHISPTLVDVIEGSLETRLTPERVRSLALRHETLDRLAWAVDEHYESYQLPPKKDWELRPYIFPFLTASGDVGMKAVALATEGIAPDAQLLGANIKRYLLYSHSLCIHDPLPSLLDFFRSAPESDLSRNCIPALKAILSVYAELAELMKAGVVLPVAPEYRWPAGVADTDPTWDELLENPELEDAYWIVSTISREQAWVSALDHRIDMFFPQYDYTRVLRVMLRLTQQKLSRRQITESFNVSTIAELTSIRPDMVSVRDIVSMRKNEETFEEFRARLGRALERLYSHDAEYIDLEREYSDLVRDEFRSWERQTAERAKKSSFLHDLLETGTHASIGAIAGGVGGLAAGGPLSGVVGAAIGGAGEPFLESLWKLCRHIRNRPRELSLRHHFLAVDPTQRS